ncbi:MAG: STAS domain-containing protein [Armatimonadetes bacterium]|nr:STAS domain-containing protein [Armatimonadota bacterium]
MIIEAREDTLYLSGAFNENHWPTLEGAVRYLLKNQPRGIIVECTEMTAMTEGGIRTFLEVLREAAKQGWRVLFVNVPDDVMNQIRVTPGLRSQLPIAGSIDEARRSLEV